MNDSTVCFLCIFRVSSPSKADSPFVVSLIQLDSFDPPSPPPLSPSPKNPDRFSSLPPELLDTIFDQAHSPDSPLRGPISSSLLPFWRQRHFKEVKIKSYKAFFSFAHNVSASTLKFVDSLIVVVAPFVMSHRTSLNMILDYNLLREQKDPIWLKDSTIIKLFKNLPSVTSIAVAGSSRLAELLLSPSVASSYLPRLIELRLRSSFESFADPFHPSHLDSLKFYLDLNYLEYAVYRSASSIRPVSKPIPLLADPLGLFRFLSVRGPLSASLTSARRMLLGLVSIETLIVEDSAPGSRMTDLFRFCHPDLVERLILAGLFANGPTTFTFPLLPSLLKFKKVEELSIYGSLLPPTLASYRQLHKLPLIDLRFERGSQLSTDGLLSLISGPTKVETLRYLVLNNVVGPMEQSIPQYSQDFTRDGLQRLVERGQVEGVVVEGEAVDCIDALLDLEAQVNRQLETQRAMSMVRNLMGMARAARIEAEEEEERRSRQHAGRCRGRGRGRGQGRGRAMGQ